MVHEEIWNSGVSFTKKKVLFLEKEFLFRENELSLSLVRGNE